MIERSKSLGDIKKEYTRRIKNKGADDIVCIKQKNTQNGITLLL